MKQPNRLDYPNGDEMPSNFQPNPATESAEQPRDDMKRVCIHCKTAIAEGRKSVCPARSSRDTNWGHEFEPTEQSQAPQRPSSSIAWKPDYTYYHAASTEAYMDALEAQLTRVKAERDRLREIVKNASAIISATKFMSMSSFHPNVDEAEQWLKEARAALTPPPAKEKP